jgi:type I restriction enzyme, S subunit
MIADLKPYADYIDAGPSWLGKVPAHWQIVRSKRLFTARKELARPDDVQLSATQAYGVIAQSLYEARTGYRVVKISMHLEKRRHVEEGDFIISMRSFQGGLERAWSAGAIRSSYVVLKPNTQSDADYFRHLFKSLPYIAALRATGEFIRDGQDLNYSDFCRVDLPLIPSAEQAAIGRFLNWAGGRIETTIRAKRRVIALLEEQRQAIVHQAVTRGLKPNVACKKSGFHLLGDIPVNWEALQVRRVVSFVTSGSRGWANYYSDNGLIFLQSGNLGRSMSLNLVRVQYVLPPGGAEGERTRVRRNDVLVCVTGALTGNVAIVDQDLPVAAFVNQHVALVRPRQAMIEPRFLAYVLHSKVGQTQFKTNEYGGTKQGLGLGEVKSVVIPVPPLAEQKAICAHLDSEVARFKEATARLEREIDLLREYRTRLVAEVVTGKLDVRAAAAHLPQEAISISPNEPLDEIEELDTMDEEVADA